MSEQEQKKSWKEFMATMLPCGHTEAQHMYDIGQSELKLEPCPFAESELLSLRAEVERLRAAHEEDNELVKDAKLAANHWRDRATKAEAALSEARKET